ncbi:MAG TPA: hypothetical protein VGE07_05100 [Herpetosiphonaceae bacterium]
MPKIAQIIIRTALLWLAAALLLGALLAVQGELPAPWSQLALHAAFYHCLMVGWVTQLIWGVAAWMFPPLTRERPRGDERLSWLAYALFNGGLALRAGSEPLQGLAGRWVGWALAGAALLQTLAVWLIIATLWPRVKGKAARQPAPKAAPAEEAACRD